MNRRGMAGMSLLLVLMLSGCTSMWQELTGNQHRQGVSSSLVDYLYPKGEEPPPISDRPPHLNLPLHVGVAFVPASDSGRAALSAAERQNLLERARKAFGARPFIKDITIVPDAYLRAGKGFSTLDQVTRMYGLDVIALVSYDQVSYVDDRTASILYWTIVGAYFIKGSQNDVQTFVDTAVFDAKTHQLLFRAPGINKVQATSTLIASPERLREARSDSFRLAMEDMTGNLAAELEKFQVRVKEEKNVVITHSPGYSGGGSFGLWSLAILGLLLGRKWCRKAG